MDKYKEVERTIITTYRKEIWSKFVRAISNYDLIKEGDKVMVCMSGGKDSFLLAKCIQELVRHGKIKFEAKLMWSPKLKNVGRSSIGIKSWICN